MRALLALVAALGLACGATSPMLVVRDPFADSFGFSCECGSHRFRVLMKSRLGWWLLCPDCGRTWEVYR